MIPIEFTMEVDNKIDHNYKLGLSLFFGFVNIDLPLNKKKEQIKKKKVNQAKAKTKKNGFSFPLGLIKNKFFQERFLKFLKRVISSFKLKSGRILLEIGLDDPSDTGELIGLIYALQYSMVNLNNTKFKVEIMGNYQQEIIKWDGDVKIQVVPASIFGCVIMLGLSPTIWRFFYAAKVSP